MAATYTTAKIGSQTITGAGNEKGMAAKVVAGVAAATGVAAR